MTDAEWLIADMRETSDAMETWSATVRGFATDELKRSDKETFLVIFRTAIRLSRMRDDLDKLLCGLEEGLDRL